MHYRNNCFTTKMHYERYKTLFKMIFSYKHMHGKFNTEFISNLYACKKLLNIDLLLFKYNVYLLKMKKKTIFDERSIYFKSYRIKTLTTLNRKQWLITIKLPNVVPCLRCSFLNNEKWITISPCRFNII